MNEERSKEIKIVTVAPCSEARPRSDTASIAELDDARLLIAYHGYRAGPEGGDDFGCAVIFLRESHDGGATWTEERLAVDNQPGDVNVMVPSLLQLDGELLLGYCRNHARTDSSMEIVRSRDGGVSFGDPTFVWRHCGEHRFSGYNCFRPLQDGRLLVPMQSSKEIWTPGEHQWVSSYISRDRGVTWEFQGGKVDLPMRGAMEPSVVQLADGELVCSLRTQLGNVFIARSRDCGVTWDLPQPAGLTSPESCTSLALLPGTQRLILFWNGGYYDCTHHHFGPRTPLSVAVSDDRGHTWRRLADIETQPRNEYTNLSCTFLRDGRAALTYMSGAELPNGNFNRTHLELKCAFVSRKFLEG